MEKQILHVDVNNAFLSWTAIDMLEKGYKEDIREIVSVIGGDESKRTGIVLAKSMKAKAVGIKTAETLYSARVKCPNVQVFASDYSVYVKHSDKLYNLLLEYTDKIERYSIDECFLDMTNYLMNDTLIYKANEISKRVKQELGFTVNIGVANNKLLAKMASDFTKPDKVHTLYKHEIETKLWPLEASELFMLGKATAQKLYNLQIKKIGDLAKSNKELIVKRFGKHGLLIWEYANGIDNSEVKFEKEKPKGVGNSVTLPEDINELEKIETILLALAEQVAYRLRKCDLLAKTVSVQLRNTSFVDRSHQGKLQAATTSTKEIYSKAKELVGEMYIKSESIRLIGLRVDNLVEKENLQVSIFDLENNNAKDKKDEKQKKIDKVVDELKQKYGYSSITRAGKMNIETKLKMKD